MKILILVVGILAGCGSSSDDKSTPSTPATPPPWDDAYRAQVTDGCKTGILQSRPDFAPATVGVFCACMSEELQKKYTQADYKAHETEYLTKSETDGTQATCKARSGLKD